ncbi:Uncharacterised protein [Klebsiella michiganensis]|uniref:Uncharacterized protein n=1 Tax=Klebsiella michiganensis TaxID=1134687 RepID=A0A7H4N8B5_9ENTR|nr:Uncharacterised protein [Klebsiella michiganensis]
MPLNCFTSSGAPATLNRKLSAFIANIVIDDLQRIDVAFITLHVDKGIFERGFTLPLGFIDALDFLFAPPVGPARRTSR